jgi:hypothetical protein
MCKRGGDGPPAEPRIAYRRTPENEAARQGYRWFAGLRRRLTPRRLIGA